MSGILDGTAAIRSYLDRLVTGDGKCRGMKVLLLDVTTTQIVSCVYSQTEILRKEVYLVSRLDENNMSNMMMNSSDDKQQQQQQQQPPKSTSHLKAVCFVRPTDINVGLIVKELTSPRFAEYHLFFSGIISTGLLRLLAESDIYEVVKQVQEFYGDYLPINPDLLSLNCRNTIAMSMNAGTAWARDFAHLYDRNLQGLQSILLSLKRQPNMIRYQASSALAQQIARDIQECVVTDQIFHFRKSSNCLLLIMDRMDDPVTPLLSQWTYQAMVHELLGLNNNRVTLKGAPNINQPVLDEVVLNAQQDDFFRQHLNSNFGELGEAIQVLLQNYQKQTNNNNVSSLQTVEEMQQFMEKFPELKTQSHLVSKHVAIMGELARLVEICSLMDVSQFEQELACADDHTIHMRELLDKLSSTSNIKIPDKLRLGLLYALRYEMTGNVNRIKKEMKNGGVPDDMIDLVVNTILRYAGTKSHGPGLYGVGNKDIMSKMTKTFFTSVQGVSNVYAQHVPVLIETLEAIMKGKLRTESHPYLMKESSQTSQHNDDIPNEIIVFMAGGVTYEEATKITELNKTHEKKCRVILGGSTVHNSTSFLEELKGL